MADPADPNPMGPAGAAGGKRTPRRARKKKTLVEARRTKEDTYRGHTLPELLALPQDDLLREMPARVRRFFRRGLSDGAKHFLAKVQETEEGGEVRTHLRQFPILPVFVGKTIQVHNGKEFQRVTIAPEMIGHKLGEFAPTRQSVSHTGPGVGATRSSKFMPLK